MVEYSFSDKSSVQNLLKMHVQILKVLRARDVVRTENNPTGDLTEYLFSQAFGWKLAPNSEHGFDATDEAGRRYQIKGRRLQKPNASRQLGALRNLKDKPFDVLAVVIFDEDFQVMQAALLPWEYVLQKSNFIPHSNSHRFIFRKNYIDAPDVKDVSEAIRQVLVN